LRGELRDPEPPMTTSTFTPEPSSVKRWTVADYRRMSELGLLQPDERTELIEGHVLFKAAKGTSHVLALRLLSLALDVALANLPFLIITQDPIQLNDFSEPEPDCAIASGTVLDYADRHPNPSDIALLVEVADSTLKYDTQVKDKIYAQSGIADYWVLDVKSRQLHVFRNPTAKGYGSHLILAEPNQVSPLAFPSISVSLTGILPP
jgi:Uma2 family endonuclease